MEIRRAWSRPAGPTWEIFDDTVMQRGRIMQLSISRFNPHQSCPAHKHDDLHEIFVCERGSIDVTVDDRRIHLDPKDVLLVRPGHVHSLVNDASAICDLYIIGIASRPA
jgi:mannose-6-phosphate isomerase-like protein (cupin superfamily)